MVVVVTRTAENVKRERVEGRGAASCRAPSCWCDYVVDCGHGDEGGPLLGYFSVHGTADEAMMATGRYASPRGPLI